MQATLGADGKKRFDAGELRSYMEMLNALAIRQARLMGLDSPVKLGIGWTGAPLGGDVLTTEQLNRLDVNQLRQLFELLEVARTGNGASIDAESRPVMETTLNFPPTPPKPATPEPELLAEPPEVEVMRRESTERYRPLREAEQIVAKLNVTIPLQNRLSYRARRNGEGGEQSADRFWKATVARVDAKLMRTAANTTAF